MNHSAILKRAFQIAKRFRVLWLFGILVALTGGGSSGGGGGTQYNVNGAGPQSGNMFGRPPVEQWRYWFDQVDPSRYVGLIILCCCLLAIFAIAAMVVHYVARVALICSVDQIARTDTAPSWREGFRLGWSKRTFRLWLLDLIVGILVGLVVLLLLAAAASPLLLLVIDSDAARAVGIVLAVMLVLLVILLLIVAGVALSLFGRFWSRSIVLADQTISAAVTTAIAQVRGRLKDVAVMWLLMLGIQIGFVIVLIPVFFGVLLVAALVGGGLGFAVYALTGSVFWAILVGSPPGLLILVVPLTVISGLFETYTSTVWTLTYREVAQLGDA